jgi:hypothetical protein
MKFQKSFKLCEFYPHYLNMLSSYDFSERVYRIFYLKLNHLIKSSLITKSVRLQYFHLLNKNINSF